MEFVIFNINVTFLPSRFVEPDGGRHRAPFLLQEIRWTFSPLSATLKW